MGRVGDGAHTGKPYAHACARAHPSQAGEDASVTAVRSSTATVAPLNATRKVVLSHAPSLSHTVSRSSMLARPLILDTFTHAPSGAVVATKSLAAPRSRLMKSTVHVRDTMAPSTSKLSVALALRAHSDMRQSHGSTRIRECIAPCARIRECISPCARGVFGCA